MTAAEIRDMTDEEITARVQQLEEDTFRLRFRSATQKLDNPMTLRKNRRDVARLKTVLGERQGQDSNEVGA